jgi:hypothetical protein
MNDTQHEDEDLVEQIGIGCWIFWDKDRTTSHGPYPNERTCRQKQVEHNTVFSIKP